MMTRLLTVILSTTISANAYAITLKSLTGGLDYKSNRVAHIHQITAGAFKLFKKEMVNTLGAKGSRIIVINSGGGLVSEGELILDLILAEKKEGTQIICVADGTASSMAFNIMSQCDVRLATPETHSTVHKVGYDEPINPKNYGDWLTAEKLRNIAKRLDAIDEPYRQANAKAMGLSIDDYDLLADQETVWRAPILLKRGYYHGLVKILP